MDYNALADLLFPGLDEEAAIAKIEADYPPRSLPEGAKVTLSLIHIYRAPPNSSATSSGRAAAPPTTSSTAILHSGISDPRPSFIIDSQILFRMFAQLKYLRHNCPL